MSKEFHFCQRNDRRRFGSEYKNDIIDICLFNEKQL